MTDKPSAEAMKHLREQILWTTSNCPNAPYVPVRIETARVIETAFADKEALWAEREAAKDAEIARLTETVRRVQASARTLDATQKQIYDSYAKSTAINQEAVATLDSERAANAILTEENAALRAEVAELVGAFSKIMPIRVHDGPDYAEVFFADGSTHLTQAMTMSPQDWLYIAALLTKHGASNVE